MNDPRVVVPFLCAVLITSITVASWYLNPLRQARRDAYEQAYIFTSTCARWAQAVGGMDQEPTRPKDLPHPDEIRTRLRLNAAPRRMPDWFRVLLTPIWAVAYKLRMPLPDDFLAEFGNPRHEVLLQWDSFICCFDLVGWERQGAHPADDGPRIVAKESIPRDRDIYKTDQAKLLELQDRAYAVQNQIHNEIFKHRRTSLIWATVWALAVVGIFIPVLT